MFGFKELGAQNGRTQSRCFGNHIIGTMTLVPGALQSRFRRICGLILALLLGVSLAACLAERPTEIAVRDGSFEPRAVELQSGDGLRFTNVGSANHTLTI